MSIEVTVEGRGERHRSDPPSGHVVRFFHERSFPADRVAAFLEETLAAGGVALAFATRRHIVRISRALRHHGADVPRLVADGRLVMVDARGVAQSIQGAEEKGKDVFDSTVSEVVRSAIERHGHVRAYGEIVDLLTRAGAAESALRLEGWWNELLRAHDVELLCGYAIESFAEVSSTDMFRRICSAHATIEPATQRPLADVGRLTAELEQSIAALQGESSRRHEVERHRNRLRMAERLHRSRALQATESIARLQRFTSALSEAATPAAIACAVVGDLTTGMGADHAVVVVPTEEGGFELLAHANLTEEQAERLARMPGDASTPLAVAYATGSAVWLDSPAEIDRRFPDTSDPELHAIACLPVGVSDECLAVVGVGYRDRTVTPERPLLEAYARQIGLALERARLYDRAQRERDRAELERARAEAASRAKDEFLAMLGHELRNPLSPILTAVQLMNLRAGGVLAKERATIERQVNHMVRMIEDLLDVSRIARGRVELRRSPIEVAQVVANAIEIASPLLEGRAHKLVVSVPISGLVVDADASRLAQVVVNLLTNAARYTPDNGLVEVAAARADGHAILSVRDNGIGIDPQLLPDIFELFAQGKQAIDRSRGGLGLGLAIARNLVTMHGGTLRAESEGIGKGSRFVVDLPLMESPRAGTAAVSVLRGAPGRARKILIVDDNVDAAEMLETALTAIGHEVRVTHDGPSALAVAASFEPEVALVDLGLPVMDGFELAGRFIAAGNGRPKLIAVTGYGQPTDHASTRAAGFEQHLVKPVDFRELQAAIERVCGDVSSAV